MSPSRAVATERAPRAPGSARGAARRTPKRAHGGAVASGLDVFLSETIRSLDGARIGLLANGASVDRSFRSAVSLLAERPEIRLTALFGPEHGLRTGAQDMVAVGGETAAGDAVPVYSLYGETVESLRPTPESLANVDVLVADLQDVGARYYTFAATIAYALEEAARLGKRVMVLDRPNPIEGDRVEGPGLAPAMHSFVGEMDLPIRHGLTMGELLRFHAARTGTSASLDVVPMKGWARDLPFEQTGLPWIPPSPNMPTLDTARVYPGACLIEATNLSEGRGTTRPFEWIGAPFLDPDAFAAQLSGMALPGVVFRPVTFVPAFQKWAGRPCGGAALHVVDRAAFRPVRTGVALLVAARRLAPRELAWRKEPYEFVSDRPAIDLLTGSPDVRRGVESGASLEEICRPWGPVEAAWPEIRAPYLLY